MTDTVAPDADKLGGVGWQTRKARMKKRIREIAHGLIKLAAQRMLRKAPVMTPPAGLYDEFCAKFPYDETEDQDAAIVCATKSRVRSVAQ